MPDKKTFLSDDWSPFLNKAIQDYTVFSTQPVAMDAKEFTAHHNACKAALGHILILKKLVEVQTNNAMNPDFFSSLLNEARKATHDADDISDTFE